jgi:hypothetical protein
MQFSGLGENKSFFCIVFYVRFSVSKLLRRMDRYDGMKQSLPEAKGSSVCLI